MRHTQTKRGICDPHLRTQWVGDLLSEKDEQATLKILVTVKDQFKAANKKANEPSTDLYALQQISDVLFMDKRYQTSADLPEPAKSAFHDLVRNAGGSAPMSFGLAG